MDEGGVHRKVGAKREGEEQGDYILQILEQFRLRSGFVLSKNTNGDSESAFKTSCWFGCCFCLCWYLIHCYQRKVLYFWSRGIICQINRISLIPHLTARFYLPVLSIVAMFKSLFFITASRKMFSVCWQRIPAKLAERRQLNCLMCKIQLTCWFLLVGSCPHCTAANLSHSHVPPIQLQF